jgi:tRNA threonylcarbamoyladenosine biosynthesis protein TsaB
MRALDGPILAVGDGAIRYRALLEEAGATVAADDDPGHLVRGAAIARVGARTSAGASAKVLPDYLRVPDAEMTRRSG